MPAPFLMPNQSGMDVNQVIKQLIEAERIPLKRLEEDNKRNQIRIQAWEELRTKAKKLSDLSRDIYSFTGPFTVRRIFSSDEGAITGTVSPNVEEIHQKIQILQLAKTHKVHSRKINKEEKLPAGRFSIKIQDKEIWFRFKGGPVEKLEKLLKEKSGKYYEFSKIYLNRQEVVLSIASKISGARGKLQFKDPDGVLKYIEIIGGKGKKEEKIKEIIFKKENFSPEEGLEVKEKEVVSNIDNFIYRFSDSEKIKQLEFRIIKEIEQLKENTHSKKTILLGPSIKEKIGEVELLSPPIKREKIEKDYIKNNQRNIAIIKIVYQTKKVEFKEFPVGPDQNIVRIRLDDLKQTEPVRLIKIEFRKRFKGKWIIKNLKVVKLIEKETVYKPIHEIDPAQDAKLLINGIEISRSKNENLTDIIPGASLTLHKVTNQEVDLEIRHDTSKIKEKIKEWVKAYNELISFIKENDKFNRDQDFEIHRSSNPNERIEDGLRKLEDASGIFAGDPIVRRLITVLAMTVGNAYPAKLQPSFKTLAQIGISTGKPGSSWQDIKKGLLIIDETKLDEVLKENPESVKELFASDKNEDAIIDDGLAFRMHRELSPYVKFAGGIITSRIQLLKEQIKQNKKIIFNKELSLSRKEEMLRQKFGRMESSIQNSRSLGKFLQNKLGIKE